jgi:AmmeMemoRadiSam system protein B
MQAKVRPPVFAGSWYPARASECEQEIKEFIAGDGAEGSSGKTLVGGIVPHAGWYFSGSIACRVIHYLQQAQPREPDVLVIFGMHLPPSAMNVMMPKGAWGTPFGDIPVAEELAAELAKRFPFRLESADRFSQDNTIELQLPFIKYFFPQAKILAAGVAPTETALAIGKSVVETGRRLGLTLKVIGSTDLTHYGANYGFTDHGSGASAVGWVKQENDRRIVEAMLDLDPHRVMAEAAENQNACCPGAVATAIEAGRHLGAKAAESISYATSYDRSPGESFVGYVGIVF